WPTRTGTATPTGTSPTRTGTSRTR
ncbi:MAG: hypothetical protein AVDCRST_MAG54-1612, partial [uncultured Actinomycetospora sp.]